MKPNEGLPRRAVLGGMATVGAAAMLPAAEAAPMAPAPAKGAGVPITFGCGLYDRMLELYTGVVKPEGIDFTFARNDSPRALFDKVERGAYDASEMSSSEYIARFSANQCPFVALPVFPSRVFRHSYIMVNPHSGITHPKQLEGKKVGVTLYTITAAIWIRGLLQHEYGVDLGTIKWIQGGIDKAGRFGNPKVMPLLKPVHIENNQADKSLTQLLADGEIDAIISANMPADFPRNPNVVRLIPNFHEAERDYYRRTKIFPIMHLVVIRKSVYEKHPFVAASLYKAFTEAKQKGLERLRQGTGTLPYMLPFLEAYEVENHDVFGNDPWPYGIEPNRPTVEALVGYMVEQGMIKERIPMEKLFLNV